MKLLQSFDQLSLHLLLVGDVPHNEDIGKCFPPRISDTSNGDVSKPFASVFTLINNLTEPGSFDMKRAQDLPCCGGHEIGPFKDSWGRPHQLLTPKTRELFVGWIDGDNSIFQIGNHDPIDSAFDDVFEQNVLHLSDLYLFTQALLVGLFL